MQKSKPATAAPKPQTKHEEWVQDIRGADGAIGGIKLNEYEQEFMDSVEGRLEAGRSLTPAQAELLEKIWDRI
jgi:hypothetical protein